MPGSLNLFTAITKRSFGKRLDQEAIAQKKLYEEFGIDTKLSHLSYLETFNFYDNCFNDMERKVDALIAKRRWQHQQKISISYLDILMLERYADIHFISGNRGQLLLQKIFASLREIGHPNFEDACKETTQEERNILHLAAAYATPATLQFVLNAIPEIIRLTLLQQLDTCRISLNPHITATTQATPLHLAIESQSVEKVATLLKCLPEETCQNVCSQRIGNFNNILIFALRKKISIEIIKLLLNHITRETLAKIFREDTLLKIFNWAIQYSSEEFMDKILNLYDLLEVSYDVYDMLFTMIVNNIGTCLFDFVFTRCRDKLNFLSTIDNYNNTLLHYITRVGSCKAYQILLETVGISVISDLLDKPNKDNKLPIDLAFEAPSQELVEHLLKVNKIKRTHKKEIMRDNFRAKYIQKLSSVLYYYNFGGEAYFANKLIQACKDGRLEMAEYLWDKCDAANNKELHGQLIKQILFSTNKLKALEFLHTKLGSNIQPAIIENVNYFIDVSAINYTSETMPCKIAVALLSLLTNEQLIELISVNSDYLFSLARLGNANLLKTVLDTIIARLSYENKTDLLERAVRSGDYSSVRLLCTNFAADDLASMIMQIHSDNFTVLHLAAQIERMEIIVLLGEQLSAQQRTEICKMKTDTISFDTLLDYIFESFVKKPHDDFYIQLIASWYDPTVEEIKKIQRSYSDFYFVQRALEKHFPLQMQEIHSQDNAEEARWAAANRM